VDDFREITGAGISGAVGAHQLRLGSAAFILGPEVPGNGVYLEIDGRPQGYFEIKNRYRDGLRDVLGYFRQRHVANSLLSGDNDREAASLAPYFPHPSSLHFNQSPQQKLEHVRTIQSDNQKVMMLGDGLNDAGALKQSDVGIVVTENTNNFTPACDAILHAGAFDKLPKFIELARWGVQTVNRAYLLAAGYNLVGLSYAVSGDLSPVVAAILMPLSSLTIVLFGTGMGHWKAWRLGLVQQSEPTTDA